MTSVGAHSCWDCSRSAARLKNRKRIVERSEADDNDDDDGDEGGVRTESRENVSSSANGSLYSRCCSMPSPVVSSMLGGRACDLTSMLLPRIMDAAAARESRPVGLQNLVVPGAFLEICQSSGYCNTS